MIRWRQKKYNNFNIISKQHKRDNVIILSICNLNFDFFFARCFIAFFVIKIAFLSVGLHLAFEISFQHSCTSLKTRQFRIFRLDSEEERKASLETRRTCWLSQRKMRKRWRARINRANTARSDHTEHVLQLRRIYNSHSSSLSDNNTNKTNKKTFQKWNFHNTIVLCLSLCRVLCWREPLFRHNMQYNHLYIFNGGVEFCRRSSPMHIICHVLALSLYDETIALCSLFWLFDYCL